MYDRSKYPKFWTIEDIKRANADAGYYFFSPSTMRSFNSRVSDTVYQGPGGIFFVTSEKNRGRYNYWSSIEHPRLYSVRQFLPETADIKTVGEFQQYKSGAAAKRAAKSQAETKKQPKQYVNETLNFG